MDADYFQAGVYLEHVATGVFGLVNYGKYDDNTVLGTPESDTWYGKVGLRERWTPLGHTVLYGEYERISNAYAVADGDFKLWGLGVVQEIDAAAMSLWVSYRNIEADDGAVAPTRGGFFFSGLDTTCKFQSGVFRHARRKLPARLTRHREQALPVQRLLPPYPDRFHILATDSHAGPDGANHLTCPVAATTSPFICRSAQGDIHNPSPTDWCRQRPARRFQSTLFSRTPQQHP